MSIRLMGMVGLGPVKTNEHGHRITDGISTHPMFREMAGQVKESEASEEAAKLGLTDMKFGRYGKDGTVTHVVDATTGKLVPKNDSLPNNAIAGQLKPQDANTPQDPKDPFGSMNLFDKPAPVSPMSKVARNDGESRKSRADRDSRLQSKPTMSPNPDDPYGDPLPPVTPGSTPKTTVVGPRRGTTPTNNVDIGSDEFWQNVENGAEGVRTADGDENGKFVTLSDGRGATLELRRSASGNPMHADVIAVDDRGNEIEYDTDVPLEGVEDPQSAAGGEFGDDADAWARGQSHYGPDEGVSMPMFREMINRTNQSVLRESPRSVLKKLVKEEYEKILDESQKEAPKIAKKLHEFREELFGSMLKRDGLKSSRPVLQRRIQLQTVSEAIEVPVNDLMLYFLNRVKATNEHHLIEYRLGCVTFFAN